MFKYALQKQGKFTHLIEEEEKERKKKIYIYTLQHIFSCGLFYWIAKPKIRQQTMVYYSKTLFSYY